MIIIADDEGIKAVQGLCDIALRNGGLQLMNDVQIILKAVQKLEPPVPEAPKE
jgi:hypothetical protein